MNDNPPAQKQTSPPDWRRLGIVAGGGALPVALASACRDAGREASIIRLRGFCDQPFEDFPGVECGIAEVGKLFAHLRKTECDAVALVGIVKRPNLSALTPDLKGAMLYPRVVAAAAGGDDTLLSALVGIFEEEGFRIVSANEVMAELTGGAGAHGRHGPAAADLDDVRIGAQLINAIGPFDVGQSVVVCHSLVLAVEAQEGTDEMLARCAGLSPNVRGDREARKGVLVKAPKPQQDLRIDLPTIGRRTIELASMAGLAGVAVAAKTTLILDRTEVIEAADEHNMFVYGFDETVL